MPLTAVAAVQCGKKYHIKIAISDAGDGVLDSGVFLEGGTFSSSVNVNSLSICMGQSATLIAKGSLSYIWSTGATTNSIMVTPTVTTSYTVTGTSTCSSTVDTSIVKVNPLPLGSLSTNPIGCESIDAVFTGSNSTPPYSFIYQLNDAAQSNVVTKETSSAANLSLKNIALGTYTLSLISVEDSNSCSSIISDSSIINVYQKPNAVFSVNPQQTNIFQSAITITNASIDANSWIWDFGDGSKSFHRTRKATFTPTPVHIQ